MFRSLCGIFKREAKGVKGSDYQPRQSPPTMSTVSKPGLAELRTLCNLLTASVDEIEATCNACGQDFPLLNEVPPPPPPSMPDAPLPAFMRPSVLNAGSDIVAAAAQLIAIVRPPPLTISFHIMEFHITTCVRAVVEMRIAEILAKAVPKGMHVVDIAREAKVDAKKLARIMRVLVTSHIFREVAPDTFAHNRISIFLSTGKDIKDILNNPTDVYKNTSGIAAIAATITDEVFKASAYLPEVLLDATIGASGEPNETAFNKAFSTTKSCFEWYELPENADKLQRFAVAMHGVQSVVGPEALFHGFEWEKLPSGALIVDVGGGIGSQSITLAKKYEHLKFIVQDRPAVVASAPEAWKDGPAGALVASGRVSFQAHDFFQPQPVQKPDIFFMRMIMHDWSDSYCTTILKHLRAAAGPKTQLVVIDSIVAYACEDLGAAKDIPGAAPPLPPAPLLPNKGHANIAPYVADIHMLTFLNGNERAVAHYKELFEASGWKLARVSIGHGHEVQNSKIIGVPA